jgi:hypothetical protein
MEEFITNALLLLFEKEIIKYLSKLQEREPRMILSNFYDIQLGEIKKIHGYPSLFLTPMGWNKQSTEITYTMAEMIEIVYRFQASIFIDGDDPKELELRAMRYREAIVECMRNNHKLGGVAFGVIIPSVDNYNIISNGKVLEYGTRMTIEVIAPHSLSEYLFD